ncbi:hypothetical protein SBOR_1060 [Sclerotinia borealis F-4128]|uniref:Gastric mucin-like protein n=1 Tax=Sclerotinia borealis (strain F-4128) TaxID=1432307 RepID=W9CR20_SCLBF|nr:hypothetical protein SBOR_1060 [Sclerotinia borealis F-4128]
MAPIISNETQGIGKLVAFEGNINTITTQLRLLPHSHMILVVPPLDYFLSTDHKGEPFEARTFVRDVHIALAQRNEVARTFLRSSSQARLVFLNGGSISARAICVATISQRLTYGNFAEAETIFHDIVKDGLAGLFKDTKSPKPIPFSQPARATIRPRTKLPKKLDLRNTKSATTLSVEDQSEQEVNIDENGILRAQKLRSRDGSGLQIIRIPGESRSVTSESSAWDSQQANAIVTTVLSIPSDPRPVSRINRIDNRSRPTSQYSGTFGPQPLSSSRPYFTAPRSRYSTQQNTDIDEDEDFFEYISQDDENLFPAPQVVYGEACVVDMQSALPTPTTSMRWTKSVGDLLLDDNTKSSNSFKHAASTNNLRDSFNMSIMDLPFERLPKAAFVKASKTTIKRSSIPSTPISGSSTGSGSRGVPRILKECSTEVEEDFDSIESVFDITEDLIIHFTDNSPREIMRSISEYKSGNFPISPSILPRPLPTPPGTAADEYPNPRLGLDQGKYKTRRDYQKRAHVDPFYFSGSPVEEEMKRRRASESVDAATNGLLLSRERTTFPIQKGTVEKFCEFSGAYTNKSIDVQNKFRSFLNFRFPEEATALDQYQNSLVPESGAFWKHMFSNVSSSFDEGPAVDQIIAVGCEKGISDVFCTQLLRQVENIGVKESGESRSGRLDLRFLIASAMQTFMSQPFLSRKDLNPLTDPRLLANLIVPHLEIYLATNSLVRFLVLSFPFDQIATVIALRSLLGSDLVKVAGVLDTLSSDPPSFLKSPSPQCHSSHHSYNDTAATSPECPVRSQRYPLISTLDAFRSDDAETKLNRSSASFSLFFKADYHLPSTASASEIQNFVTLIRKNIVERLSWYNIEQVPLQPSPIPNQTIFMKDASTSTDELLFANFNTDLSPLIVEQDSFRFPSSLYDSESSEIEVLRSPTRLSPFPMLSRITGHSLPPPHTSVPSSSHSLSSSTIRHIPIAIERQPMPQDFTPSYDEPFPDKQNQNREQEQDSDYTYEYRNKRSLTPPYLDRVHSNTSSGSLEFEDLEFEAEEDSEDDAYDRMVMGRYSPIGAKRSMFPNTKFGAGREEIESRAIKGNSRKALKWLGLA